MAFSGLLPVAFLCVLGLSLTHQTQAQNSPQDFLAAHNAARQEVGVSPLTWDANVEAYARDYAIRRSGDCQLQHSGGQYGENLFEGYGADYTAANAVNDWVNEKNDYDYSTNNCAPGKMCGHYTQVVWRDSVRLGCARAVCNNGGGIFITCNYDPPGNYVGKKPY